MLGTRCECGEPARSGWPYYGRCYKCIENGKEPRDFGLKRFRLDLARGILSRK